MKYQKFLLFVAVSVFCCNLSAQNIMYNWRTHLAYTNIGQIAMTADKIYAVSDGAMFSINRNNTDAKPETYSKINGLSDNNIVFIAYSQQYGEMLVAYQNGNIDFIGDDGQILNFPDVYRANLTAEKSLNDVLFDGEFAYLSYPFGIVKLSLSKMEVTETYFIGENNTFVDVKSLSILDGYFYAVTADKIYKALSQGVNLINYANWNVLSDVPDDMTPNVKAITYNSKLYLLKGDGNVHVLSNGMWQNNVYSGITNICINDNVFFAISDTSVYCSKTPYPIIFNAPVKMAMYDSSISKIWAAGTSSGIILSNLTTNEKNFVPSGPATNQFWQLKYSQDNKHSRIYGVPGARPGYILGNNTPGRIMIFENNYWKNIYCNVFDIVDIAIDSKDKTHFYAASYQNGILEFRNDAPFVLYNSQNSGVESINTSLSLHMVDALYLDSYSRLWFAQSQLQYYKPNSATIKYLAPDPDGDGPMLSEVVNLFYMDTGGDHAFAPDQIIPSPTNENIKFMLNARGTRGIFVFDDNGTPDNVNDDINKVYLSQFIDQDGRSFAPTGSNKICAAQDKINNTIWVGGDFGLMVLSNLQNIFNSDYRVTRIKIPRNDGSGLADYLLGNEVINSIAVDGDNRKWIGTVSSGVFLMSDDGTETIYHFTTDNSPLLSDNVICIAINDKTGEVFFGTDKGLISFQSDAIPPTPEGFNNLHAYPNPVRPEHLAKGIPVTITGLAENSVVKIVDTAGNLVYETFARGAMTTWDCRRKGGAFVSTGFYIAICTTKDGKFHATTKILVVN